LKAIVAVLAVSGILRLISLFRKNDIRDGYDAYRTVFVGLVFANCGPNSRNQTVSLIFFQTIGLELYGYWRPLVLRR
jgi:hypothetical protein